MKTATVLLIVNNLWWILIWSSLSVSIHLWNGSHMLFQYENLCKSLNYMCPIWINAIHTYIFNSNILSLVKRLSVLCKGIFNFWKHFFPKYMHILSSEKFFFEFLHLFVKSNSLRYILSKHFQKARICHQIHILIVDEMVSLFIILIPL